MKIHRTRPATKDEGAGFVLEQFNHDWQRWEPMGHSADVEELRNRSRVAGADYLLGAPFDAFNLGDLGVIALVRATGGNMDRSEDRQEAQVHALVSLACSTWILAQSFAIAVNGLQAIGVVSAQSGGQVKPKPGGDPAHN